MAMKSRFDTNRARECHEATAEQQRKVFLNQPNTMKIKIQKTIDFTPVKAMISAKVQYWEDGAVNGVQDDEESPLMPLKFGPYWRPEIEVATGRIVDWPTGATASVHYKVCDQGEYWLEDASGERIKYPGNYVPCGFCPGGEGYGDYIIMNIGPDGVIENWKGDFYDDHWSDTD